MARKWAWTGVAITSMWIAVLFTALFAPTFEAVSAAGDTTKFPIAGVVAAGVAFVATIVVAAIGFRDGSPRDLDLERERLERKELEARLAALEHRTAPDNEALPQGRVRTLLTR